jgi:hypothetical protein
VTEMRTALFGWSQFRSPADEIDEKTVIADVEQAEGWVPSAPSALAVARLPLGDFEFDVVVDCGARADCLLLIWPHQAG